MYIIISPSRDDDDLSVGFHRSITAREKELTNNKTTKRNYQVRIRLGDVFGFAPDQHDCTYG